MPTNTSFMRCFYEVLGVERNCETSDLKKAYYKASLQWHPDKNYDRVEEAKVRFQEIQESYRVLSDAQERAWYDRHRDEILRGGQGGIGGNYKEERLDVFQFFSRSCFSTFDDSPKGFFTVYRKVFDDITAEERRACDQISSESEEDTDAEIGEEDDASGKSPDKKKSSGSYPTFGCADSDYAAVVRPFYAFWEAFSTRKSYAWMEPYDTRHLSCRAERRCAEAENRKTRETARRQRNEEVRQLVSFVMRRDKRIDAERQRLVVVATQATEKTKQRASMTRERNATHLKAAWDEELATGGLASQWADEMEAELARLEAEFEGRKRPTFVRVSSIPSNLIDENYVSENEDELAIDTDEEVEDYNDELFCIACNKVFASRGSKRNHEASKKHKKLVAVLRSILLEDEAEVANVVSDEETDGRLAVLIGTSNLKDSDADEVDVSGSPVKLTKRAKKARRRQERADAQNKDVAAEDTAKTLAQERVDDTHTVENYQSHGKQRILQRQLLVKEEEEEKKQSLICLVCGENFLSKNKLFAHIKETNHAALKPAALAPAYSEKKAAERAKKSVKRK